MNVFVKNILLSCVALIASSAFADSSETILLPDAMSTPFNSAPGMGISYGFYPNAKKRANRAYEAQFGVNQCVTGDVKDEVFTIKSEPFANPTIVSSGSEVKVIFIAQTSNRRVLTFGPNAKISSFPKDRFSDLCGEQYIAEAQIGKKIAITRSFKLAIEDHERLIASLRSRLSNIQSLLTLDLSKENFKFTGAGMGLSGGTNELSQKMNECFWQGRDCKGFVSKAYADAAELDKYYPPGRVANLIVWGPSEKPFDGGDFLVYKLKSYSK